MAGFGKCAARRAVRGGAARNGAEARSGRLVGDQRREGREQRWIVASALAVRLSVRGATARPGSVLAAVAAAFSALAALSAVALFSVRLFLGCPLLVFSHKYAAPPSRSRSVTTNATQYFSF